MELDKSHIDKVISGKYSLKDQKILEKSFEDDQQNQKIKRIIQEQWDQFDPEIVDQPNLDHVFYKLYYTVDKNSSPKNKQRNLYFKISQIAAILIVGLMIAGSIYFSGNRSGSLGLHQIEFVSQTGFRNQFRLPDGTSGWLGYGSRLNYQVDKNHQRIVNLDGLAYFDVTHNDKQPFIVETPSNLSIKVLGTSFNVMAYKEDHGCEVVLERGKVSLSVGEKKVDEMKPGQRIVYSSNGKSLVKSDVNVDSYLAWKDGILILDDVSLKNACVKLSRFYNTDFELQGKYSDNQKVRLILQDENIDEALKLLSLIVPIKYKVVERKLLDNNSFSKKKIFIKAN